MKFILMIIVFLLIFIAAGIMRIKTEMKLSNRLMVNQQVMQFCGGKSGNYNLGDDFGLKCEK